jgi:hypothetical protein
MSREVCNCAHGAECPTHPQTAYTRTVDQWAERRTQSLTTAALQTIADALEGMVRDSDRFNSEPEANQYTELCLTGEEAALALKVIRNILKPLPPGTMTNG